MLNKYLKTLGYSIIIVLMIALGVGCIFRYCADINFDKARKLSSVRGRTESKMTSQEEIKKFKSYALADITYYYNKAVGYNFLEKENYARRINSTYLKELLK